MRRRKIVTIIKSRTNEKREMMYGKPKERDPPEDLSV
jgi:hypothetical protein